MAHFAKINTDNIVVDVVVVEDSEILIDGAENEQKGVNFLNSLFHTNYNWKQTSYNTLGNVHAGGGTPFRKNYAGKDMIYDSDRNAFYVTRPWDSWSLNETTCLWEAPVTYPDDGKRYKWNEENRSWDLLS
tara:strand:- start:36 stop:428 length:393 start_codon:yes stop_codon:yes gene_type:complete